MFKRTNMSGSGGGISYSQITAAASLGFGTCQEHTWVETSKELNAQLAGPEANSCCLSPDAFSFSGTEGVFHTLRGSSERSYTIHQDLKKPWSDKFYNSRPLPRKLEEERGEAAGDSRPPLWPCFPALPSSEESLVASQMRTAEGLSKARLRELQISLWQGGSPGHVIQSQSYGVEYSEDNSRNPKPA